MIFLTNDEFTNFEYHEFTIQHHINYDATILNLQIERNNLIYSLTYYYGQMVPKTNTNEANTNQNVKSKSETVSESRIQYWGVVLSVFDYFTKSNTERRA